MRLSYLAVFAVLPCAAFAQDHPSPAFFAGHYEVIGRNGDTPIADRLRLTEQGSALAVTSCNMGDGRMTIDHKGEGPFTTLILGGRNFGCQYFIDWDNYALLACVDDTGSKITLWPIGADAQESLTCAP